jgi:UDP-N-acetylglucosamine 3-dehydrogenase
MLRVGVIGVGSMGRNHSRAYFHNDLTDLVACSDTCLNSLDEITKRYRSISYADYKVMIDNENLDAVSIAVPTELHKEISEYALSHNLHVLLEKPIASNEPEAQDIIACAKEHKKKLMIGHIERFNPAIVKLKERLEKKELGEIYKIDVERIGPFPSRVLDVGVVVDLSVHDLDIVNYLMGSKVERAYAETQRRLHPTAEDSVIALIKYENDVLGVFNVNYLSPSKIRKISIFGKKGMFAADYLEQELYFHENQGFGSSDWDTVVEGDVTKIRVDKKEPLQSEIDSFVSSIINDTPSPITGEEALEALKTAYLLLESAKRKEVIDVVKI